MAVGDDLTALPQHGTREASLRILLADGRAASRHPLQKKLVESGGHVVHPAANGREALALAGVILPQVVITDWFLPDMDGLELCRTLRGMASGLIPYILILSDVVTVNHLDAAFDEGVDDYLLKPVTSRDLHLRLRAGMRQARLREALVGGLPQRAGN